MLQNKLLSIVFFSKTFYYYKAPSEKKQYIEHELLNKYLILLSYHTILNNKSPEHLHELLIFIEKLYVFTK